MSDRLATVDGEKSVRIWKLDGTVEHELIGHTNRVESVAWSPAGNWIASAGRDKTLRFWNSNGSPGPVIEGQFGSLAWSPRGDRVAVQSLPGDIQLWNADGSPGPVMLGSKGFSPLSWSPNGERIACYSTDRVLAVWDAATGRPEWISFLHDDGPPSTIRLDDGLYIPDTERFARGFVFVEQLANGKVQLFTAKQFHQRIDNRGQ